MPYKAVIFEENHTNRSYAESMRVGLNMTPAANIEDNFDRYYSVFPENEFDGVIMYAFFVRPQLNLLSGPGQGLTSQAYTNPICRYIYETSPECIHYLSRWSKYQHHFIPYFTGRVESTQVPDFTLRTALAQNSDSWYQMPYAQSGTDGASGGSFDVTFRDDNKLRILNTHRLWVDYTHNVTYGLMDPFLNLGNTSAGPIGENRIDYAGSLYNIACRVTGREIIWWDKYTGIFPTNIPDSNFSFNKGSTVDPKFTISYSFFYHNPPCDPCIFGDFNYNAQTLGGYTADNYDSYYISAGNGIVGVPYITRNKITGKWHLNFTSLGYRRSQHVSSQNNIDTRHYTTSGGSTANRATLHEF